MIEFQTGQILCTKKLSIHLFSCINNGRITQKHLPILRLKIHENGNANTFLVHVIFSGWLWRGDVQERADLKERSLHCRQKHFNLIEPVTNHSPNSLASNHEFLNLFCFKQGTSNESALISLFADFCYQPLNRV